MITVILLCLFLPTPQFFCVGGITSRHLLNLNNIKNFRDFGNREITEMSYIINQGNA